MGRPTECTPATIETFCAAIRIGATYRIACQAAGFSVATLAIWRERGARGEQPYLRFVDSLAQAEAHHAQKLLGVLDHLATGAKDERTQLDAARFTLSTRYRDDYGKTAVEVSGPNGGPIAQVIKLEGSIEQLRALAYPPEGEDGG